MTFLKRPDSAFRHIDAGIQHIHRDGNLGQFLRVGEIVDGALGIFQRLSMTMAYRADGILLVEHLQDGFGVAVILGKDDGLAQFFAVVDFQAVGHQQGKRLADGILVENPLVQGGRIDVPGQLAVFIGEGILVLGLFLGGQFIVDDALGQKFQLAFHREIIHQEPVLDGLGQLVAVGGHTVLQLKDLVCILVDFVLGVAVRPTSGASK